MPLEEEAVQHVFICGAKSIGLYGGFETFVGKLAEYSKDNSQIKLHIICKANGEGHMEESRLPGAQRVSGTEFTYCGAHCVKLPVPHIGHAAAVYYDWAAVRCCLDYCGKQKIAHPVIYVLSCRIGPLMGWMKKKIRRLGGALHVNPDGHEWMRGKWPAPVRRYLKLSERLTVRQADALICDSEKIQKYILEEYAAYHPRTFFILYGAEPGPSPLADDDPAWTEWAGKHGLQRNGYYLAVGRFVPENNYEAMIREFMRSRTARDFVLVTDGTGPLRRKLENRLNCGADKRIKFVGTVYDQALLKKIRENAFAYLHGHEVGGTNPSLLESMCATDLNLLLDVDFNREAGGNAALYWSKEPGSLAALIERAEEMTDEERNRLSELARKRVMERYSWQKIAGRYASLWLENS